MHWRTAGVAGVLSLVVALPFLDQAFHVDDTNFLALASHAVVDPLGLYDFEINWGGTPERAFDILANPPLGPWYLALVSVVCGEQEWVYHLSFVPFLFMVLWGCGRLAERFVPGRDGAWALLQVGVSPALVLSAHTVMPDLLLVAFYVWGVVLSVEAMDRRAPWRSAFGGLVAGGSALCRYSGLTVVPLLGLYAVLNRRRCGRTGWIAVVASMVPSLAWGLASWLRYGRIHLLAMTGFQARSLDLEALVHKGAYQVVALGLCVVPAALLLAWSGRGRGPAAWPLFGGLAGLVVGWWTELTLWSLFWITLGLASAGLLLRELASALEGVTRRHVRTGKGGRSTDDLFLALWVIGILVFNQVLLFAATRYLLLLVPPLVLLVERRARARKVSRLRGMAGVAVVGCLSLSLSAADASFASVYRSYAEALPAANGQRWFCGHWGLQYYLEARGARPLNEASAAGISRGDEIVVATYPWPQEVPPGLQLRKLDTTEIRVPPGLRTFSVKGKACFYANMLSPGPIPVLLPYTVSSGPLERLVRYEVVATPD